MELVEWAHSRTLMWKSGKEKIKGEKVDMGWVIWSTAPRAREVSLQFSSVQFSCSVVSDFLRPHESQHARPPCPSPTPGVHSNSCPSSQWCHPAISSSDFSFSSCPQSLPASGSFPVSRLSTSGGQSIGVSASASVLPMNTQDCLSSIFIACWTAWFLLAHLHDYCLLSCVIPACSSPWLLLAELRN